MSYTATWILILISWVLLWRWCAHYYTARGVAMSNRMAVSGSQPVPAARSAQPGTPVDPYAQARSEAIQGLLGLKMGTRAELTQAVVAAQNELRWSGTEVNTENLLRCVMAKRAAALGK